MNLVVIVHRQFGSTTSVCRELYGIHPQFESTALFQVVERNPELIDINDHSTQKSVKS